MKTIININGMSCQNCAKHVTNALNGLEGVENVVVNLDLKQAELTSSVLIEDQSITQAIENVGYKVSAITK